MKTEKLSQLEDRNLNKEQTDLEDKINDLLAGHKNYFEIRFLIMDLGGVRYCQGLDKGIEICKKTIRGK